MDVVKQGAECKRKRQGSAKQNQYNKIRKGKYNERYERIKTEIPIEYLEKEGRGGSRRLKELDVESVRREINTD